MEKSRNLAFKYYMQAAEKGHEGAQEVVDAWGVPTQCMGGLKDFHFKLERVVAKKLTRGFNRSLGRSSCSF